MDAATKHLGYGPPQHHHCHFPLAPPSPLPAPVHPQNGALHQSSTIITPLHDLTFLKPFPIANHLLVFSCFSSPWRKLLGGEGLD